MKRRDLIKHLEKQGCLLLREGGKHTVLEDCMLANHIIMTCDADDVKMTHPVVIKKDRRP